MGSAISAPEGASASSLTRPARNAAQLITTRLQGIALDVIAKVIDKDESTACRVRSNEQRCTLSEFCKLLELADLKVVDRSKVCVDRQAYDSLTYIAQKALANQETARTLVWDEEQGA